MGCVLILSSLLLSEPCADFLSCSLNYFWTTWSTLTIFHNIPPLLITTFLMLSCRKVLVVGLLQQRRISPSVESKVLQVRQLLKVVTNLFTEQQLDLLFRLCLHFPVKPRKGDALLFYSLYPDATPDTASLHAGCPVEKGEKWSATKWIHVDSFDRVLGGNNCTDSNENCERWASLGECNKNPEYMIGSSDLPGYCRKSCKVC